MQYRLLTYRVKHIKENRLLPRSVTSSTVDFDSASPGAEPGEVSTKKENVMEEIKIARLTHEAYDEKQVIEFPAQCDIHEYIDQIERLLVSAGFNPDSVKDGIVQKAAEIEIKDQEIEEESANEEDFNTE